MFNVKRFRELERLHRYYDRTYASEVPGVLERHWEELTRLLVEDMEGTISYLKSSSVTADEIADISEVFDEVIEARPSREFIDAARLAAKRFPETCQKYNILSFLEAAEKMIPPLPGDGTIG